MRAGIFTDKVRLPFFKDWLAKAGFIEQEEATEPEMPGAVILVITTDDVEGLTDAVTQCAAECNALMEAKGTKQ